jgi:DMSO/TMAO reductase YedYZ molybdopterin-dependent catalytic subunit
VTLDKSSAARITRGAVAGFLAGGLALGIAQLVAGLISSTSSPVVAVGELSIDFTPPAVKDFAITAFGPHDKLVLVIGILAILAVFAAVIGVVATRNARLGTAGLGLFVLVGLIAALTRPNAGAGDALPTLVGGAVAVLALRRLAAAAVPAGVAAPARSTPPVIRADSPPPSAPARTETAGTETAGTEEETGPPGLDAASQTGAGGTPAAERPETGPLPGMPAEWRLPQETRPPGSRQPGSRQPGSRQPGSHQPGSRQPGSRPPGGRLPAVPAGGGTARQGRGGAPAGQPRRSFLTTSAVVAGSAVAAGVAGNLLAERGNVAAIRRTLRIPAATVKAPPLPVGSDLRIPGLASFVTPNSQFYRVDTAIVLPEVTPTTWTLRVHGMVAREITLTFDDLIRRPLIEDWITLCCVSNPVAGPYIGNAKWLGASLRSLLQQAGIKAGATQLLCTSVDGFTSGTPVEVSMDGRDSMLAVAMNGSALPVAHGFPARLVVPGLYGYVSACKWITDIEVTTYEAAQGYWVPRGWSAQAPIKTESRIDVPNGASSLKAGRQTVAGVAWAQHKGIEAVEVRVDNGPWNEATLAAVPDLDTWRQWVWDWDATPGSHVIEARATDKTGYTQTSLQEPPEPNGASGYPIIQVQVS